jgi:hydrogenase nickel incorporation protein HypA/HybF
MHELSLCESLLAIIDEQAQREGFSRVSTVFLEVGQLAGVEADALHFCFDAVTRDSIANGAQLVISQPAGQAHCRQCQASFTITTRYDSCPQCQGIAITITQGQHMRITELEVA